MRTVRATLVPVALFLRVEYLVFALLLPILGAASVRPSLTGGHALWLLVSALFFHVFISVQNDIVDLNLDRTDPRRKDHPLVQGRVSVKFASLLTLLQIPLVATLSLGWGINALLVVSMVLVFGMLSVYNLWGKRTAAPIGTDLAQGLGFGAMALYGAASAGSPNALSWMVFWGVVVWMMQTNHLGGLRDLKSDFEFAATTTPISLGCAYDKSGPSISGRCRLYSYFLLSTQLAVPFMFLLTGVAPLDPPTLLTLALVLLVSFLAGAASLAKFFAIVSSERRIEFDYALVVMYLSALPMLAVLTVGRNPWVLVAFGVVLLAAVRTYLRILRVLP